MVRSIYNTREVQHLLTIPRGCIFFRKVCVCRHLCIHFRAKIVPKVVPKVWLNYNRFILSKRTWFDYWWVFVGVFSARFSYFVGYFCGYPHFYPAKVILFCDIDKYFYDRLCFFRKFPTDFGSTIGDLGDFYGLSVALVSQIFVPL